MKDSHIGTFGVIGLIVYFLLMTQMSAMPLHTLCAVAFCADTYSKWCASHLINFLPYARKEEESKAQVTYRRMSAKEALMGAFFGWIPVCLLLPAGWMWICLCPPLVFFLLCLWMKKRLGGYTGDCCGALFLLCELSFYLCTLAWLWK